MTIFRVIDFETTGLSEDGGAICEIGWADVLAPGVLQGCGSSLVNPGKPIPPEIQAIHHIGNDDVADAPPLDTALGAVGDTPDYYVAHNAKFEQAFFDGGDVPWVCTYKVALRLWPDAPSHSNQVLRYWLGIGKDDVTRSMPPHRAGPDAYVTALIFIRMLAHEGASIEDFVRWSSGPPLLPKVTFGKHRGAKWEDVPTDYLEWMLRSDMDNDIKANARHRLRQRGVT